MFWRKNYKYNIFARFLYYFIPFSLFFLFHVTWCIMLWHCLSWVLHFRSSIKLYNFIIHNSISSIFAFFFLLALSHFTFKKKKNKPDNALLIITFHKSCFKHVNRFVRNYTINIERAYFLRLRQRCRSAILAQIL